MKHTAWQALCAGALPILAVSCAYALNVSFGLQSCNNLLEGCMSVSRAVRSGPGLLLFKVAAVPAAACMALAWWGLARLADSGSERNARGVTWMPGLGLLSAACFLIYALALGGDGSVYAWMRRYGVVLYFGGCGLAQLLAARWLVLAGHVNLRGSRWPARVYLGLLGLTWTLGVVSAAKRRLVDDPALQDRLQNALEWNLSLCLSLGLVVLAWWLFSRRGER